MNDSVKVWFWRAMTAMIVVVAIVLLAGVLPAISKYKNSLYPSRSMVVSAVGKTTVSPDIAETSFSVLSRGVNPEDLQKTNTDKMNAVIDAVKAQGIEERDIKTTGYNLSPDYQYNPDTQRSTIIGYTLTQTVTVKVRDLSKVASLLGSLTRLGVNQIGGVSFRVDDESKAMKDAREDAFKRAAEKAREMAEANGVELGEIINVSDYQNGPMPYYSKLESSAFGRGGAMDAAQAAPAPSIQPGSEELSVTVSITYALR